MKNLRIRKNSDVTDANNGRLALQQFGGSLETVSLLIAYQSSLQKNYLGDGRSRNTGEGLSFGDGTNEGSRTSSSDKTGQGLGASSVLEGGLRNRPLHLPFLEFAGALDDAGNLLSQSLGLGTCGGGKNDTEEGGVRVRKEESFGGGARDLVGGLSKRRSTRSPLDGGLTTEEVLKDLEVGRSRRRGTESDNHGRCGSSRRVDVEGHSGFTTVVSGLRSRELGGGAGTSAESVANGLGENLGGDTGTDNSNVGLGESSVTERLHVVNGDGIVLVGVEGVTETSSESKGVGKVKGDGRRNSLGRDGLRLNNRENKLIEFVLVELRGGKNGSEDVEEVFSVNVQ